MPKVGFKSKSLILQPQKTAFDPIPIVESYNCKRRPKRCNYIGLFIYSYTALHVSGDVFAHHQEQVTVFTASGNVHRYC